MKKMLDVASKGPILSADARNEFKLNRVLNFTCSFKKSRPKPKLTWSIGGKNVSTNAIILMSNLSSIKTDV